MENQKNPVVEEFAAAYKAHWELYDRMAKDILSQVKTLLDACGIMAIVSSRAKDPDRLGGKLYRLERDFKAPLKDRAEIAEKLHDLVGVRIALYFPEDSARIRSMLGSRFTLLEDYKVFPPKVPGVEALMARGRTAHERRIYPGYSTRRFDGYHATHHYIRVTGGAEEVIAEPIVEIQVASVLMHAWSEVEHDLAYKKMTGDVSREEYECLDEINGLVIAGEIALNRLSRLSKRRSRLAAKLDSPYALKNYLAMWLEEKMEQPESIPGEEDMINAKQLFEMYQAADVLSSTELEYRLRRLGKDVPDAVAPLVQMLVDQFFEDKRKIAKEITAKNAMRYLGEGESFYTDAKIGQYLTKWNILEDTVRKAVRALGRKCSNNTMSWKAVVEERVLPENIAEVYRTLRLQRNIIVHSNRLPEEEKFRQLLQDMDALTAKLKQDYNLK